MSECEENIGEISEWNTCIRLPIKPSKRNDRLRRNFDDIHAKLLLFLNRLRRIEIVRQKGNGMQNLQVYTRVDHAQGQIIELQKQMGSEAMERSFWLVVKKVVQLPINIKV